MAKVYLNIEAENPSDLHSTLQAILAGAGVVINPVIPANPAEKTTRSRKNAPQETTPATIPADPVTDAEAADDPVEDKQPRVKIEDLRGALKALGSEKARALVADFGGSKLTEVPEERYADLLAEAQKRAANG